MYRCSIVNNKKQKKEKLIEIVIMFIKYIQEDNLYDYFVIRYIVCNFIKIMYMYYISIFVFKIYY